MEKEGVIKFQLNFKQSQLADLPDLSALNAWRQILFGLGLTGQNPARYNGLGFGNVSVRAGAGFVISGTQTGGKPQLDAMDYCLVRTCDVAANCIDAEGPIQPSSEALTHGAVYAANPAIACVLHVHCPVLWRNAAELGMAITDRRIAYGTPAMAQAIGQAIAGQAAGVVVMGGHEDGVLAFAQSPEYAALWLLRRLVQALEAEEQVVRQHRL